MGNRAGRYRACDVLLCPAEPAAEPCVHMAHEGAGLDPVEQLVADPVGLDDARVQRVADAVRARDELEVGPGPLEGLRQLCEPAVGLSRRPVLEKRPPDVGAAESECIRRVGVAREEERAPRSCRDRPAESRHGCHERAGRDENHPRHTDGLPVDRPG